MVYCLLHSDLYCYGANKMNKNIEIIINEILTLELENQILKDIVSLLLNQADRKNVNKLIQKVIANNGNITLDKVQLCV